MAKLEHKNYKGYSFMVTVSSPTWKQTNVQDGERYIQMLEVPSKGSSLENARRLALEELRNSFPEKDGHEFIGMKVL